MKIIAAVDFGTSHVKCAAFTPEGELLRCLRRPNPTRPDGAGSLYPPDEAYETVRALLLELRGSDALAGIAVTGMAEAGLLLHKGSLAEASGILPWFDRRTLPLAEARQAEDEAMFTRTGLHNSYKRGLYKCRWLLDQTGLAPRDTVWLSVCDYLVFRLTGRLATDPTFAARTGLCDLATGGWSATTLEAHRLAGLGLPEILPSGRPAGMLQDGELAAGREVPVAVAGHDHLCAAWAAYAAGGEGVCNSMGTAETYLGTLPTRPLGRAEYESGLSYGPFIEADTFYWMANIPSSGMAVEWLRRVVPPGTPPVDYDTVDRLLAGQPAGPSGLLFGPFLSGMGTPSYNERLRGCLLGLDENTGFAQMLKAVVEGVALQGRSILTLAPAADGPLLVAGGAANSAPWMQLKADVMQRPLRVSELREGALYGAAGLLARQLGAPFARPQGCSALYTPNTTLAPAYAALHHRYQGLVDWLSAEAAQPREHQGKQQEEQQQNG